MDERQLRARALVAGLLAVLVVGLIWALNPAERPEPGVVALDTPAPSPSPTGAPEAPASPDAASPSPDAELLAAALPPDETTVQVLDAGGGQERLESAVAVMERLGYQVVATTSARQSVERTTVWFTSGKSSEAEALRARDARFAEVEPNRGLAAAVDLHVLIGPDWG